MREHTSRTRPCYRAAAGILAAILLFGLLPLQAGAVNYTCGLDEHVHTDACYEEQEQISYSCTYHNPIHAHDDFCFNSNGELVCPLEEASEHTHTDECYTKQEDEQILICGQEEIEPHSHTDACMAPAGSELVLGCIQEHEHTDGCYIYMPQDFEWKIRIPKYNGEELPLQVYFPDGAYAGQGMWGRVEYTDPAFEQQVEKIRWRIRDHENLDIDYWNDELEDAPLILDEAKKYSIVVVVYFTNDAGESVYGEIDSSFTLVEPEWEIACGKEESEGHTHTESCYETIPGESILACELPERHIHEASCYDEDGLLLCGKDEAPIHQHTDECRKVTIEQVLTCGLDEHQHTEACLGEMITIGGIDYPKSDFLPMQDSLTGAELTSGGNHYDLMDEDQALDGINLYQGIDVELDWFLQAGADGSLEHLYYWQFAGITLESPLEGDLIAETGEVYGVYLVDTDGTAYIVLNETGMQQSVLSWTLSFSAKWAESEDGQVVIDLGNGHVVEIELDLRRAAVEKEVDTSNNFPSIWEYTVDIQALDDIVVTSIDDIVSPDTGYSYIKDWSELNGIPVEDALWMQDVVLALPDGTEITIPEDQILIDVLEYGEDGEPLIRYHMELAAPIEIPAGESAVLTYRIQLDPELTIYLDLKDAPHYRLDNTVEVFLENGDSVDADAWAQHSQRDMVEKTMGHINDTTVEWEVQIDPGIVYSLDGMLVQDTIIPEFEYLTDSSFSYLYGDVYDIPQVHLCESLEEFSALTDETAGGMVHIYENSFKFFIPHGGELTDEFYMFYKSTYDAAIAASYGSGARLNHAELVYKGMADSDSDGVVEQSILKTNDGIHIDEEGLLYTNWTTVIEVPKDTAFDRFSFEDYVPTNDAEEEFIIADTLHLNEDLSDGDTLECYTLEEVEALGVELSIVTQSGEDITERVFGYFDIKDLIDSSEYHYFTMTLGDKNHIGSHGGFDAMEESYTVTITVPMYLNGDATVFREHENRIVWYFTEEYNNMGGRDTIYLPYINNDELLSKKVVSSESSADGTKTILTYQARYNMYDKLERNGYESGSGYTFSDELVDTTYAQYIPGSLKVYWTETIDDSDVWTYGEEGSPYFGESDLLKIQEDVPHKIADNGDVNEYVYVPLATLQEESEAGFTVSIPYYMPTNGYRWHEEGHSTQRFYSPLFEYQVEVDSAALANDKQWRYHVENEIHVYLTDGTLDAMSQHDYSLDSSVMQKGIIQMPTKDNEYVVKYQLEVDASSDELKLLDRIDVVDTMNSNEAKLLADQMVVEYSEDKAAWMPLPSSQYQIMYDDASKRITCLIDNESAHNYYRITYALQLSGLAGDRISLSNSAYVVGYREQGSTVEESFEITSSSGYAEGQVAQIRIYKYNSDNVEVSVPGAVLQLSRYAGSQDALNGLSSQDAILSAIGDNWIQVAQAETDADGSILWTHNGSTLSLPLNVLYKLEEIQAPSGYLELNEPIYFYLSASNENPGNYLQYFTREPIQTILYVANNRSSFVLEKQDKESGELLTGASFALYGEPSCSGDPLMESVDYEDGTYYFGDLEFGKTYYLKEIVAPDFYELDDTVYTVTVSEQGIVSVSPSLPLIDGRYVITNQMDSGPELPETGGSGVHGFFAFGLLLSAAGILIFIRRKGDMYA